MVANQLANLAIHHRAKRRRMVSLEYQDQLNIYKSNTNVNCGKMISED